MDKLTRQTLNKKLTVPFVVALIGIFVIVVGMLLPYMTACGDLADYIKNNPDRVEVKSLNLTASDLADIPLISVSNIITGVYGEDDGTIANIIVLVFSGFLALTAMFTFLKKPIAIMLFTLLTGGTYAFLNFLMKEDFIAADKYGWGFGYYVVLIGIVAVLASAIWMLVKKIIAKKELKAAALAQSEI